MKAPLFTTSDILAGTGGRCHTTGRDWVSGVATDSRLVEPGDLFVALIGARVDGHDYVESAFARGAHLALVQSGRTYPRPPHGRGLIEVADPWRALGDLAAYHLRRHPVKVVGVTGSIGKTSTKDLIASVLREQFQVLSNHGNQNSDIGLPLTLFRLKAEHEVAVLEMGMRGPGQIARLGEIACPHLAVITNIDSTHIEVLGSIEAIADAKAELLAALPKGGTAVLNWDSPWVRRVANRAPGPILSFGLTPEADFFAQDIASQGAAGSHFTLHTPAGNCLVKLPLPGRHMVTNALAAAAVGVAQGLCLEAIVRGFERAFISAMRGQILSAHGLLVVDDAYNAHPQSVLAALDLLRELQGERKIAVLGSMLELGTMTEAAHHQVGEAVAMLDVDCLVTVGDYAAAIARAAAAGGLAQKGICICRDNAQAMESLSGYLRPNDTILVKGSRGLGMEEIVAWLKSGRWLGLES